MAATAFLTPARCTIGEEAGGSHWHGGKHWKSQEDAEPLTPGAAAYSEEQTRRNFERIQRLVVAGEPAKSVLLMNPLAEDAGASHWHGGGKH